jgi:hypothetical protein
VPAVEHFLAMRGLPANQQIQMQFNYMTTRVILSYFR